MNIELRRTNIYKTSIDGAIYIDNAFVCHTAENVMTSLPAGEYLIGMVKCKQYKRNMPVILTGWSDERFESEEGRVKREELKGKSAQMASQNTMPCCSLCQKIKNVNHNTRMPQVCPMLKPGNGVHKREDGSIILGTRIVSGCLSHPRAAFENFYNRIRKKLERERKVVLRIKN